MLCRWIRVSFVADMSQALPLLKKKEWMIFNAYIGRGFESSVCSLSVYTWGYLGQVAHRCRAITMDQLVIKVSDMEYMESLLTASNHMLAWAHTYMPKEPTQGLAQASLVTMRLRCGMQGASSFAS